MSNLTKLVSPVFALLAVACAHRPLKPPLPPPLPPREEARAPTRPRTPPEQRNDPPLTLTPAQACYAVNSTREVPIYCRILHANGMHTMIIKFLRQADAEQHEQPMLKNIAEPFCAETNSRGEGGLVEIYRQADGTVATFNCETGKLGPSRKLQAPTTPQNTQSNTTTL